MDPFKSLHYQEKPLHLGNVWDLQSALLYQKLGFKAMIVSPLFAKPEGTSESPSGANNWRQLCLRRPGYACVHTGTPLRGAPGITTMLNAVSLALCFLFTCAYAQTTRKLPAPTVTPLRGYPGLGCHRSLTHRFPGRQRAPFGTCTWATAAGAIPATVY